MRVWVGVLASGVRGIGLVLRWNALGFLEEAKDRSVAARWIVLGLLGRRLALAGRLPPTFRPQPFGQLPQTLLGLLSSHLLQQPYRLVDLQHLVPGDQLPLH